MDSAPSAPATEPGPELPAPPSFVERLPPWAQPPARRLVALTQELEPAARRLAATAHTLETLFVQAVVEPKLNYTLQVPLLSFLALLLCTALKDVDLAKDGLAHAPSGSFKSMNYWGCDRNSYYESLGDGVLVTMRGVFGLSLGLSLALLVKAARVGDGTSAVLGAMTVAAYGLVASDATTAVCHVVHASAGSVVRILEPMRYAYWLATTPAMAVALGGGDRMLRDSVLEVAMSQAGVIVFGFVADYPGNSSPPLFIFGALVSFALYFNVLRILFVTLVQIVATLHKNASSGPAPPGVGQLMVPWALLYAFLLYPTIWLLATFNVLDPRVEIVVGPLLDIIIKVIYFMLFDHETANDNPRSRAALERAHAAELAAANESKRRFVRYLSHELRVPLNSLALGLDEAFASVALLRAAQPILAEVEGAVGHSAADESQCAGRGGDSTARRAAVAETAQASLQLLRTSETMMSTVVSVGRTLDECLRCDARGSGGAFEAGSGGGFLQLEPSSFCPADMARETLRLFAHSAASRRIVLELDVSRLAPPVLFADEARLRQVLNSLLRNALTFSPPGGVMRVRLSVVVKPAAPAAPRSRKEGQPAPQVPLSLGPGPAGPGPSCQCFPMPIGCESSSKVASSSPLPSPPPLPSPASAVSAAAGLNRTAEALSKQQRASEDVRPSLPPLQLPPLPSELTATADSPSAPTLVALAADAAAADTAAAWATVPIPSARLLSPKSESSGSGLGQARVLSPRLAISRSRGDSRSPRVPSHLSMSSSFAITPSVSPTQQRCRTGSGAGSARLMTPRIAAPAPLAPVPELPSPKQQPPPPPQVQLPRPSPATPAPATVPPAAAAAAPASSAYYLRIAVSDAGPGLTARARRRLVALASNEAALSRRDRLALWDVLDRAALEAEAATMERELSRAMGLFAQLGSFDAEVGKGASKGAGAVALPSLGMGTDRSSAGVELEDVATAAGKDEGADPDSCADEDDADGEKPHGLGLALSLRILALANGRMGMHGRNASGEPFALQLLPLVRPMSKAAQAQAQAQKGGETVHSGTCVWIELPFEPTPQLLRHVAQQALQAQQVQLAQTAHAQEKAQAPAPPPAPAPMPAQAPARQAHAHAQHRGHGHANAHAHSLANSHRSSHASMGQAASARSQRSYASASVPVHHRPSSGPDTPPLPSQGPPSPSGVDSAFTVAPAMPSGRLPPLPSIRAALVASSPLASASAQELESDAVVGDSAAEATSPFA